MEVPRRRPSLRCSSSQHRQKLRCQRRLSEPQRLCRSAVTYSALNDRTHSDARNAMLLKTFGGAFWITAIGLILAFLYGGPTGLAVAAILTVLEISLSFDNAVINATVLGRMNEKWQRLFLTVGVIIAAFGMRLLFPVLIVCVTATLSPVQAYHLAMD